MSDVTAFLRARLDDDEKHADQEDQADVERFGGVPIYRNVPGTSLRTRRDVAAKRGVVREMEAARTNLEERGINVPFFITWTLWHLAAVYSDHPDYRQEWQI